MSKANISEMNIVDVVNFVWNFKPTYYYLIVYRGKTYRKYSSHWSLVLDGECQGLGSVEQNFSSHLDRAFEHHFGGKTIRKESKIIIE